MDLIPIDKEIQKKIYDDLFSPSLQEAWEALKNVVWLVTTITLPFAYAKKWTNKTLDRNLENYQQKLLRVPIEDRIDVLPEAWVPILEKLNYYSNEKLVDLFTELLAKASDKNNLAKVHPKYINIVENLSEDEALILEYINKRRFFKIPFINIHSKTKENNHYSVLLENYSDLFNIESVNFPENMNAYTNNLISLWILKIKWQGTHIANDKLYSDLEKNEKVKNIKPQNEGDTLETKKWVMEVTHFWISFLDAIFNNNEE